MVLETVHILYGFVVPTMLHVLFLDECSPAILDNETDRELRRIGK